MMIGEDVDRRVVLRDHRRPKPTMQTLGQLKKVAKLDVACLNSMRSRGEAVTGRL